MCLTARLLHARVQLSTVGEYSEGLYLIATCAALYTGLGEAKARTATETVVKSGVAPLKKYLQPHDEDKDQQNMSATSESEERGWGFQEELQQRHLWTNLIYGEKRLSPNCPI